MSFFPYDIVGKSDRRAVRLSFDSNIDSGCEMLNDSAGNNLCYSALEWIPVTTSPIAGRAAVTEQMRRREGLLAGASGS